MPILGSNALTFAHRAGALYGRNAAISRWPTALTRCPKNSIHQTWRYASKKSAAAPRAHKLAVPSRRGGPTVSKATPTSLVNMVDGHWNPLAKKLASKASPSILYESQSKSFYVVSCYGVGLFCTAWAGWNAYDNFLAPPLPALEISDRVRIAMGITCVFMLAAAAFFFSRPARIIHSIRAIPSTSANGQRTLRLEIKSGNLRRKAVLLQPDHVSASSRLYTPGLNLSSAELAAQSKRNWANEKKRILTLPFRQMYRGFKAFQALLFGDDWIRIYAQGHFFSWKMDRAAAWALDDGKAFDALIKQRL